jgi:26S proteasome non-ATPase regulatory subunit 9
LIKAIHKINYLQQTINKMERLKTLQARREALEIEAECITQELTSPGVNGEKPAGIKDSLVDSEGFPRGDIDIYDVRNKRQRLAVINTDYTVLMKEIEKLLGEIYSESLLQGHQQERNQKQSSSSSSTTTTKATTTTTKTTAAAAIVTVFGNKKSIAIIDEILMGSPSETAGLKNGDELISFGGIDIDTTDPISKIPPMVRDNVDKVINIIVKRKGELVNLSLIPKLWKGNGLLGCHLTPRI